MAAAIPDARLVVYADTAQLPNWERPENVAREIQRFIAARK
jgi:pimeloyl-ACP methyl ester carboxylesterase